MADDTGGNTTHIRTRLVAILRIGSAGLLLGPGVSKILTYSQSVRFFATLGFPHPEILVPVVGGIELVAAGLFLLDRRLRVAAILVMPIMSVAVITAGPTWQNLGVLTAAFLMIGLETTADANTARTATST